MTDTITISFTIDRPDDLTMAAIIRVMAAAIPKTGPCKMRIEGATLDFAAAFEAGHAIARAQRSARGFTTEAKE